ncbi:MAG: UDP-glucose 4-epimerase GalE [Thermodesulfobacteriota bacterium]|nr:UDP-glucose 4-epimerase GalE [Thermodesulfobacteriota bacterium]
MNILVCGGAGYIGSHMLKTLAEHGHSVVTFDNLSTGHKEAVRHGSFVRGDLLDRPALKVLFSKNAFDAVMHFSALSIVSDSVAQPELYHENNVTGTLNLLSEMLLSGVRRFIFSSSAAVYGAPKAKVLDESHPVNPVNPYGETKLAVERALAKLHSETGLDSLSLRYFNAAGAHPEGEIGESHNPETHLIPVVLKSVLEGRPVKIFGDDYDTEDGTCVRDYIHVMDLCSAHLLGLEYLQRQGGAHVMNLGNGQGFSVLEVIRAAERVTGREIPWEIAPPRPGDPARLVASSELARRRLGWSPHYTQIETIIETAWKWHRNQAY